MSRGKRRVAIIDVVNFKRIKQPGTIRRIVALIIAISMLSMIIPCEVTVTVEGKIVKDPFDIRLAPHFQNVIYLLGEPEYSTSCDARGYFKVNVGLPTLTSDDSKLVFSSDQTSITRIVLSSTDVSAINQTTIAYYQMSFSVKNSTGYTNISLFDNGHNDYINISVYDEKFYVYYTSGSQESAVLYAPCNAGSYYNIGFELSNSSVTLYLYSSDGTLLADKFISDNDLVAGYVDELRFEMSLVANTFHLDYLYVMTSFKNAKSSDSLELSYLRPDSENIEERLDLDPTTITEDLTMREELFGLEDPELGNRKEATYREIINQMGLLEEKRQRVSGRMVAEGWKNLKDTVEDELELQISKLENVDIDDVYLVDYYIDYIQIELDFSGKIVANIRDVVETAIEPIFETLGEVSSSSASATMSGAHNYITIDPRDAENLSILSNTVDLPSVQSGTVFAIGTVSNVVRGLENIAIDFWETITGQKAMDNAMEYADKQYERFKSIYDEQIEFNKDSWNQSMELVTTWMRSSEEQYAQLNAQFMYYMDVSQATTESLISEYSEAGERVERMFNYYYDQTQQTFQATNAIIAKLILQNYESLNESQQMARYFAGELASSKAVLINLTQSLIDSLSVNQFWQDVYDDGKPSDNPLTVSGFFGNDARIYTYIFIGIIFLSVCAIVALLLMRSRSKRSDRRARS